MKELESLKVGLISIRDAALDAAADTAVAYDKFLVNGDSDCWKDYIAARDNSSNLWDALSTAYNACEESEKKIKED